METPLLGPQARPGQDISPAPPSLLGSGSPRPTLEPEDRSGLPSPQPPSVFSSRLMFLCLEWLEITCDFFFFVRREAR